MSRSPHVHAAGRARVAALLLACALVAVVRAQALPGANQVPASTTDGPGAAPTQPGPTDPAELKAFLDELLSRQLEERHIAGAAVAVVQDGALAFAGGYGYADLENGIPVDPARTMFRIASVTKSFTATAVMQLFERGALQLDADVNTYLDFRIPETYPQPITLRHLLTHTAGFEDLLFEVLARDPGEATGVRDWLVSHMPARVRPPGEAAAYSNYGTSLAGYIVARVAGQPFDAYLQEHLLGPLGMAHTTARSPVQPELRALVSKGYTYVDGSFRAAPDYFGQPAMVPAGGLQASATDMARFMIMHLQDGRYDAANPPAEGRALLEGTAQLMHSTQYAPDARMLGTAYGFFDFSDNGQRTIGHGGDSFPMSSLLLLLPDQNLGVFVVYNSEGGADLTNQHLGFQRAFFDHYFPAPAAEPLPPRGNSAERAGRFVGKYRLARGSYTTLEKVTGLFGAVGISDAGDGALQLDTPWGAWRFQEVEPLYFRQPDGPFAIAFREDDRGRITHLFTDLTPMFAFERLRWFEAPAFNLALALACVVLFLSIIGTAAFRLVRNRRPRGDRQAATRGARVAERIILAIAVLNLLFVAGTVVWGDPVPLFGVALIYKIVLGLGVVAALLTVGALVSAALAWTNGYWGIAARTHYTLATVAALAFVWFLDSWNLLGWRF